MLLRPVLLGAAGIDPLVVDVVLDPPHRELGEPADGMRGDEPAARHPGGEALLSGVLGGFSGVIGSAAHLPRASPPPGAAGPAKQIAATASPFLLLNSLAGLAGKAAWLAVPSAILSYAPLFAAVPVGGQIGSRLGVRRLPARWVKRGTTVVVLIAAANLLLRSMG